MKIKLVTTWKCLEKSPNSLRLSLHSFDHLLAPLCQPLQSCPNMNNSPGPNQFTHVLADRMPAGASRTCPPPPPSAVLHPPPTVQGQTQETVPSPGRPNLTPRPVQKLRMRTSPYFAEAHTATFTEELTARRPAGNRPGNRVSMKPH